MTRPGAAAPASVQWAEITVLQTMFTRQEYSLLKAMWKGMPVLVKRMGQGARTSKIDVESDVLRRVEHRNIVRPLGWGSDPHFAIYEDIDTTVSQLQNATAIFSLANHITLTPLQQKVMLVRARQAVPLNESTVLSVASQVADALVYLHEQFHPGVRLILNTLNPDTIGITSDGVVKIMDLGECMFVRRAVSEDVVFRLRTNVGTWQYRSPEQFLEQPYNQKTDIFSLSIVINQMVVGRRPTRVSTSAGAYLKSLVYDRERPEVSIHWRPEFVDLMSQCWNADIAARPSSVDVSARLWKMRQTGGFLLNYSTLW